MAGSNRKKQRVVGHIVPSQKFFIFCEGEKTEPFYFQGFKNKITENPIYKNSVTICISGLGKQTLDIVEYAKNYVKENHIEDAQIWCVYDKDSFLKQDFNLAETIINNLNTSQDKNTYYAAWSNQCIEYWFILHFSYYTSDNDRKYYSSFLNERFAELGLKKYAKNNKELFNILVEKGDPKKAIIRANKQLEAFTGCTPSKSAPATKIHLLVLELAKYLPEDLKQKFI